MSSGFPVRPLSTDVEYDFSSVNDEIYSLSIPVAKAIAAAGFSNITTDEQIPEWRNVCTALINYKQSSCRASIDRLEELRKAAADLMKVRQFFAPHKEVLNALDALEEEIEKELQK